ncbi:MAG: microcystin degradation protein MlrC [Comamonadaceae bacterium SCN 68-20]|nr:MAG: microcystin degradation protein MlrC [Comamonadaceae bacterium SCN 68-20]
MRILVAGFQHETNTFAPSRADWAAFQSGAGYPETTRGAAMLERMAPTSLPIGGFLRDAAERGWHCLPSIWAAATPSAQVTRDAFERIADALLADARANRFDAVYLDLHGAAVAEHVDDAEGELLERLRAVVGPSMPIVASLDLHANVTRRMLRHASAMTAFRTYPHVDMAETGARAAALLAVLTAPGAAPFATHAERLPFLLPLNAQCTLMEPAAGVFADLAALEAQSGVQLSFAMGFPAADFDECGPVVFGHGRDAEAVQANVRALAENIVAQRSDWALDLLAPDAAVARALELATRADKPVVIADTQDNPGAGGDGNTTGLLHALLAAGAGRRFPGGVALGLLHDAAAAAAAHEAGLGATLELSLGASVRCFDGRFSEPPVTGRVTVTALSDGRVPLSGPMTAGNTARLGRCACVAIDGVRVLLSSSKTQMLDLDLYRFLGVEPASMKLLVNKSSVHFRAAFAPIASHILVAQSAGPMAADPADLPWQRLPSAISRHP